MVPQQNKGCKHFPEYSRPNLDQIISKNSYVHSNFIENRGFSIKIAKKFKIVAKANLGIAIKASMLHLAHAGHGLTSGAKPLPQGRQSDNKCSHKWQTKHWKKE